MDPPVPEAGWEENSILGAEKAAKYFLQLYAYVYQTGDLTEWDRLCHPESEACANVREEVANRIGEGSHESGGEFEFDWAIGNVVDPNEQKYVVEVQATRLESERYSNGQVVESSPAKDYYFVIVLYAVDGQWKVRVQSTERLSGEGM